MRISAGPGSRLLAARRRRRVAASVASLALLGGVYGVAAAPAHAAVGTVTALGGGFDACTAPSSAMLDAWYNPSPYWWVGIYIGGDERACSQPNLTASWISANSASGWGFEPLWVGPQMSSANGCSSTYFTYDISTNTTTASRQGAGQANAAVTVAQSLGFGAGSTIYYDLEAFSTNVSSCVAAARAFVAGWDYELGVKGFTSGVYGSSCGSSLPSFASLRYAPTDINGADWDGDPNTNVMSCVASSSWGNGHRLKQYEGGHNETWGGYTDNIDSDCAYGAIDDITIPNDAGDGCN